MKKTVTQRAELRALRTQPGAKNYSQALSTNQAAANLCLVGCGEQVTSSVHRS